MAVRSSPTDAGRRPTAIPLGESGSSTTGPGPRPTGGSPRSRTSSTGATTSTLALAAVPSPTGPRSGSTLPLTSSPRPGSTTRPCFASTSCPRSPTNRSAPSSPAMSAASSPTRSPAAPRPARSAGPGRSSGWSSQPHRPKAPSEPTPVTGSGSQPRPRRTWSSSAPNRSRTSPPAIDPRYGTLVRLAAYTGLRAGEIGALRIGRVDLDARRLTIAESVTEVQGHGLVFGEPKT
jgi:hypothetical protein